jgi:CBS domain containing-hemolysin-like protein
MMPLLAAASEAAAGTEPIGLFEAVFKCALVIFLVLLNGFFVAAEFALVKVRDTQLQPYANRGHGGAKVARRVISNLDACLSATQLGITLASLGLGWFAEPFFEAMLDPVLVSIGVHAEELRHGISFALGFSVITFLHIVAGELAPKSLAIQKPVPTTLWIARPLLYFYKVSYPFIWLLNSAATKLLKICGLEPVAESEHVHTEEELRLLIHSTQRHVGATALETGIILNAMDLRQRKVRDIMRPRNDIAFFDTEELIDSCFDKSIETRFSRYPLCQAGDLDQAIGVVHIKDLHSFRQHATTGADLRAIARPMIYIPEVAHLEKILGVFLARKLHFALVVDEFGTTIGMVTLENILEELVGQIQDEHDQELPQVIKVDPDTWHIHGNLPIHSLEDFIGVRLEETDGLTSASGWITQELGGFPRKTDRLDVHGFRITVTELDGPRVQWFELKKLQTPQPGELEAPARDE